MASDERRAHERTRTDLPVQVTLSDGATLDGRIENIGEYGIFFTSTDLDRSIEAGDRLTLRFRHDDVDATQLTRVLSSTPSAGELLDLGDLRLEAVASITGAVAAETTLSDVPPRSM